MMVRLVGPHFEDVDFLTAARAFSVMKTRQKWKIWSYWIVSWTLHPVLARDAAGKAKEATTPNFNLFLIAYKFFELAESSMVAYIFLTEFMNQWEIP